MANVIFFIRDLLLSSLSARVDEQLQIPHSACYSNALIMLLKLAVDKRLTAPAKAQHKMDFYI